MILDLTLEERALCRHLFVWPVGNGTMLKEFEGWQELSRMEKRGGTRSWPFATDFQQHQIHPSWHRPSRMRSQILSRRDLRMRVRRPRETQCRFCTNRPRASQNRHLRPVCLHGGGFLHYSDASRSGSEHVVPQRLGTWHRGKHCTPLARVWAQSARESPAVRLCWDQLLSGAIGDPAMQYSEGFLQEEQRHGRSKTYSRLRGQGSWS